MLNDVLLMCYTTMSQATRAMARVQVGQQMSLSPIEFLRRPLAQSVECASLPDINEHVHELSAGSEAV